MRKITLLFLCVCFFCLTYVKSAFADVYTINQSEIINAKNTLNYSVISVYGGSDAQNSALLSAANSYLKTDSTTGATFKVNGQSLHVQLDSKQDIDSIYLATNRTSCSYTTDVVYEVSYYPPIGLGKIYTITHKKDDGAIKYTKIKVAIKDDNNFNVRRISSPAAGNCATLSTLKVTKMIDYQAVTNLKATTSYNSSVLSWTLPTVEPVANVFFNGVALGATATSYTKTNLKSGTEYTDTVTVQYADGTQMPATVTSSTLTYPSVTDLTAIATASKIDLSWTLPNESQNKITNVYVNDVDISKDASSYSLQNLLSNKFYTNVVKLRYADGAIRSATVTTKTLDLPATKTQVTAIADVFSATLLLTHAQHGELVGQKIYLDSNLIYDGALTNNYVLDNLKQNTAYKFDVVAVYADKELKTSGVFKTKIKPKLAAEEVKNLAAKIYKSGVKITFDAPTDEHIDKIILYRNNVRISDDLTSNEYIDNEPLANANNVYRVVTISKDGVSSVGVTATVFKQSDKVLQLKYYTTATNKDAQIKLSWTLPQRFDVAAINVYKKNQDQGIIKSIMSFFISTDDYTKIATLNATDTILDINELQHSETYEYAVALVVEDDGDMVELDAATINVKTATKPKQAAADVQNLKLEQKNDAVKITYDIPTADERFDYVRIYRNNVLIADKYKQSEYTDTAPTINTTNIYRVVTVSKDAMPSTGVSESMYIFGDDVSQLGATATAEDVILKWHVPQRNDLQKLYVYRDNAKIAELGATATTYTDSTVANAESYKYRVTTVIAGVESSGVEIATKTQTLQVSNAKLVANKDAADVTTSYTLTWQAPKIGKIDVIIAKNVYKQVDAAALTLTIPAADLQTDKVGNAKLQMQPYDKTTKKGVIANISTVGYDKVSDQSLGVDTNQLLIVVMGLIGLIALFVLLALAFGLAPRLLKLVTDALK